MVNTCVCCGDIIPEGSQVCYACCHDGINCPDCGAILAFMAFDKCFTETGVIHSKLYHCEKCHADWEIETPLNEPVNEIKRKFWG